MKINNSDPIELIQLEKYENINTRYPGTIPFPDDEISRKLFYGRKADIETLYHKVLVEDLILIYSRSGMGKTSLLNAGLIELLRKKNYYPLMCRVYSGEGISPQDSIFITVEDCLKKGKTIGLLNEYSIGNNISLWTYFKTLEIWSNEDILLKPILIIDQFEEIFTAFNSIDRKKFIEQFGFLVRDTMPEFVNKKLSINTYEYEEFIKLSTTPLNCKIVISMREEFLANLSEIDREVPNIRKNEFRLLPLNKENARLAIEKPANIKKDKFSDYFLKINKINDLVDAFYYDNKKLNEILDFLINSDPDTEVQSDYEEVDPTQLQILCQYIEEKVKKYPGKNIIVDNKFLPGKSEMQNSIQNYVRRIFDKISSQKAKRNIKKLIEEGFISKNNTRISLAQIDINHRFKVSNDDLSNLVKARLLRADYRLGQFYYELSHDTLIKALKEKFYNDRIRVLKLGIISIITICIIISLISLSLFYSQTEKYSLTKNGKEQEITKLQDEIRKLDEIKIEKDAMESKDRGEYVSAVNILKTSIEKQEIDYGKDSARLISTKNKLASVYLSQNNLEQAEEVLNEAVEIAENDNIFERESEELISNLKALATKYMDFKKNDFETKYDNAKKANNVLNKALIISKKYFGNVGRNTIELQNNLASIDQYYLREKAKAIENFKIVLESRIKTLGSAHQDTITSYRNLANSYEVAGDKPKADEINEEANIIQMIRNYFFFIENDESDSAAQCWVKRIRNNPNRKRDLKDQLKTISLDTEYYKIIKIDLKKINIKDGLANLEIEVERKLKRKKIEIFIDENVQCEKENNEWKISKLILKEVS